MGSCRCCTWNSPWSKLSRFVRALSIVLFIADIVTDAVLAADYYARGLYVYFWWTLGLALGPAFITSLFSFCWECDSVRIRRELLERRNVDHSDHSERTPQDGETEIDGGQPPQQEFPKWLCLVEGLLGPLREPVARITCQAALWNLLLLGSLFRSLRSLFAQKRHGGKEDGLMDTRDAELLHLMESFLEAAPQLVLQLSIIIMENSANEVQVLCVVLSLFSLALSIKSYLHALREANYHLPPPQHQHKLSCKGQAMMLLWRLGMISSRGVAMAIFFTGYGAWLLLVVGIHWAVMFVCHLHQKTTFTFPENLTYEMLNGQRGKWKILLKEWFYDFVMAGVTVFCFMNLQPGRSRGRMTFYYSIMFIENSVMAVVWCLSTDPDDRSWDTYLLLTLVWGSFVFGLIWLALYYQYGHPNKQDYQLNAVERFIHHALFVLQKDVLIRDAKLDSAMRETEV